MFSPELMFNAWNCYALTVDGEPRPGALEIFTPVMYTRGSCVVALPTLDKWTGKSGYYQVNSGDDDWWNATRFAEKCKGRYRTAREEYDLNLFFMRVRMSEQLAARQLPPRPDAWRVDSALVSRD